MIPIIGHRVAYARAVRRTAAGLVEAHGAGAGLEARRVSAHPGLTAPEQAFCEAVALRVAVLLDARDAAAADLPDGRRPA